MATIGGAGGREQRSEGRREKPDRDVTDEHERVRGEAVVEVEVDVEVRQVSPARWLLQIQPP